jgi:hypothetical protein
MTIPRETINREKRRDQLMFRAYHKLQTSFSKAAYSVLEDALVASRDAAVLFFSQTQY